MLKFYKRYHQIFEDGAGMTDGSTLGPTQGHSANIGQSGDFYAPGDVRNLFGDAPKPQRQFKSKFRTPKPVKHRKNLVLTPVIRRNFPKGL